MPPILYDDSLIISRIQQKELLALKPGVRLDLSSLTTVALDPFLDQLPIKIGLRIKLLGPRIINCRIERGFMFADLENHLSGLNLTEALIEIARLNQRTPIFNQIALCLAMEQLFGINIDQKTAEFRTFLLEFSRIFHHWHVIRDVLMVTGRDGMLDLALTALSLMKDSHDQLGHVGSRPLKNIRPKEIKDIIEALDHLAREIDSNLGFDPYLRQCLRKKAVITLNLASSFGLSGSFLRANRNLYDNRPGSPGYMSAPTTQLADGGDTWARFIIRIREILASIEWLKQHPLLKEDYDVPDDFLSKELFKEAVFPLAFGQVDAPEGDVKISIFIDKKSNKLIYRIRTPAYFIAQALPHLLSQADLKDLPLILYSLGITAEEIDR